MDLLDFILDLPDLSQVDWSEADTRAQFIDPVLSLLGWSPREIKREPYAGWNDSRGFVDYLLLDSNRPMVVIEAKKTGRSFQIPSRLTSTRVTTFKKLRASSSSDLKESLEQCLRYAQHTGALYACATNGLDWIVFKPTHPYRSLPDAKVVIFHGTEQISQRIDEFICLLSPSGVQEGCAEKELLGRDIQVPTFSKRLQDAFPYKGEMTIEEEVYSNSLDQVLQHYVLELTDEVDFQECYIPTGGNKVATGTLESLVSDRVKAARDTTSQTSMDFGSSVLSSPVVPNVACGRTVVLHGEVGAGKTSFLRYCELCLREAGKLEDAVWARVDLLPFQDRNFDSQDVKELLDLICKRIQSEVSESTDKMSGRYDPDVWDHLRDIYNSEVRKLQKARFPDSDDSDPIFLEEARKYVWDLHVEDPQDHQIRVIRWLTINCKLPVIVVLDNSDQLGIEFQEFLYKLSETIQSSTSAVVILVMRSEALESHIIREHSIASVREQFLVEKAPLAAILGRRFHNILKKLPEADPGSTDKVTQDRVKVLMDTIQYEAKLGSEAFQLIEAAGNGNLRDNLRAVSAIFRSSPRVMDQLVYKQHNEGKARITVAETLRALMREDLSNSDSNKLIPNIFSVDRNITMPYSLGIRQLQQVRSKNASADCTVAGLLNDFSIAGVDRTIAMKTLARIRADRFLSVGHMLPELRDTDILRLTRLGSVLLEIILMEKSYYGRVAFNTYIYRKDVYLNMRSAWTSDASHYYMKFDAISKQFVEMVMDDDEGLQKRIDLAQLEPIIGEPLPGLLGNDVHQQNTGR